MLRENKALCVVISVIPLEAPWALVTAEVIV